MGVQAAVGQGPASTRPTGSCPTRGAPRRRCPTSRSASTTPPGPARTRRSPSRFTPRARRLGRRRRPMRILAWTTTPWTLPSNLALAVGPDIDVRGAMDQDGVRYVLAEATLDRYDAELDRRHAVGTVQGRDLVGRTYEPLFPYFADEPERLPGPRRRLRRHRRGHRRRAHGARLRRGRPAGLRGHTASSSWCRSTTAAASPPRCPTGPGENVFDANPTIIRRPQGRRRPRPPRDLRPQLPPLLAHRHADHLRALSTPGTSRSPPSATAWSS